MVMRLRGFDDDEIKIRAFEHTLLVFDSNQLVVVSSSSCLGLVPFCLIPWAHVLHLTQGSLMRRGSILYVT